MEKIRFSQFRKETYHRKVIYVWLGKNGERKAFKVNQFYCNKCAKLRILSMPKFNLSVDAEFFRLAENHYLAVSELGKTQFVVVV